MLHNPFLRLRIAPKYSDDTISFSHTPALLLFWTSRSTGYSEIIIIMYCIVGVISINTVDISAAFGKVKEPI